MSEIIEKIKEKGVEPLLNERMHDKKGYVTKVNFERGRADVRLDNPEGDKEVIKDIPISIGTEGGVSGESLKKGDFIVVSFQNGRFLKPHIVQRVIKDAKKHRQDKHESKKGAYTPRAYGRF
jgi:hypothetical protein